MIIKFYKIRHILVFFNFYLKNVQQKQAHKIVDVDYDLISGAILLFVSIKVCDIDTSLIICICI